MQIIDIKRLIVSADRQRREFDPEALMELCEDIQERGLMQPIVVRETEAGPQLVAGERRLRAIQTMWELGGKLFFDTQTLDPGFVPTVTLGELTPLQALEAEFAENAIRMDLTWQERAEAMKRLDNLRRTQAKVEGKGYTASDLAEEVTGRRVGHYVTSVNQQLAVAYHLDDPDVAKAKTVADAFKILKRKEEVQRNADLAIEVGRTFGASLHKLYNEDCLTWMRKALEDVSAVGYRADVILTDPPYGMGADEFGDAGGALVSNDHRYVDDEQSWHQLISAWAPLSYAIAKPAAHLYAFCDIDRFAQLRNYLSAAGWRVHRTPLIWHKPSAHRVPWPEHGPRRHYELICYAVKGDRPVNFIGADVLSIPLDDNLGHPAQKPVALYRELLRRSVQPGAAILDSFCATGPVFPAAHELKCIATGVEVDASSYAISINRLKELK